MTTNQINFADVIQGRITLEDILAMLEKEKHVTLISDGKAVAELTPVKKKRRIIGLHAGGAIWMANDFDAPLEDFEEYM